MRLPAWMRRGDDATIADWLNERGRFELVLDSHLLAGHDRHHVAAIGNGVGPD